ncbi:MAG: hypothetical protein ACTS22_06165 [Phycisphaerales bacterium]
MSEAEAVGVAPFADAAFFLDPPLAEGVFFEPAVVPDDVLTLLLEALFDAVLDRVFFVVVFALVDFFDDDEAFEVLPTFFLVVDFLAVGFFAVVFFPAGLAERDAAFFEEDFDPAVFFATGALRRRIRVPRVYRTQRDPDGESRFQG